MSRTYKATGINLKSMALGESDRLLTILTREFGLIRAVAPGARKQNSSLSGRSSVFVVNELLVAKGRSLDKITQAETQQSYPGLSQDLSKLFASQYLAEIVLYQALSEQPQEELFNSFNHHLSHLEVLPKQPHLVLVCLCHAIFDLLTLAGITPQVDVCCLTGYPLHPDLSDPQWQAGFSAAAGGTVSLSALERVQTQGRAVMQSHSNNVGMPVVAEMGTNYQTIVHRQETPALISRINASELAILQKLSQTNLNLSAALVENYSATDWVVIEQILRQYAQYHFGRPIRSAGLIDSYYASLPTSSINDDATV